MQLEEAKELTKKAENVCCGTPCLEERFVTRWPDGSVNVPKSW